MLAIALLAIGVATDLVVESTEGVAAELSQELAKDLASAIHRATGLPCLVGENGGADRVAVSLFGAVTRIRIIAARRGVAPIQIDVARERDLWAPDLDELARGLYRGSLLLQKPRDLTPIAEPVPEPGSIGRWVMLGAGATVLAVGIGFVVASLGVRGTLEEPGLGTSAVEDRFDRERMFVGIGAGAIVLGAGLLITSSMLD